MSDLDALLASLPIDSIAAQLGEDPDQVRDAAHAALPALLGGLDANAREESGAASILEALAQHEDQDTDGIDVSKVDTADGERIAAHIFGSKQDEVVNQLGTTGASSGLIRKLIPILAPIVLAWLANRMTSQGARPSSGADQGVLGTILEQVLKGAGQGSGGKSSSPSVGSILGDVLGGLLGGGRR
jgi:hypothetical protein